MSRLALVLSLGVALASTAFAQTKPTLIVTFDEGLDGVGPQGPIQGTPVGKPELAPSRFGKALKSGSVTGFVDYPTNGVLNRLGGTVEMWVSSVDWLPEDGKFHVFFETKGQGALYLYKYWVGQNLLMLACPELEGPYASSQSPTGWKLGEWHHIAGTWSLSGVMCYLDGKPAGKMPVQGELPRALGPTFRLGDQEWQFPRTTSSLIDEVRIYDRALTPAHIAAHATGDTTFQVNLSPEVAQLDYDLDPVAGQVQVRFDTGGADVEDARVGVRLAVVAKGKPLPADSERLGLTAGHVIKALPLVSREPGDYEVQAAVSLDGKDAFELRRPLVIPATPWLGNQLGLEDKVLPPWTPVRVEGTTVSCWGRSYRFDQAALPTQMASAGADLLARPISLHLTADGREVTWQQAVRAGAASATRAELTGTAVAQIGGAPRTFTTRLTTEYDGLLLVEVSCDRPDQRPPQALSLEIPVKAEHAVYRHRYGPEWMPISGFIPPGEGVVDKAAFIPYAWFGDNDRGLFWFCESDEMWPNSHAENAVEVIRSGGEIALRLNLVATDQKLPPNWKLVFGLQATPVKAIPKDWRKWRLDGNGPPVRPNVEIVWPNANAKDSLSAFGYPEAADPALFAAYIKGLHDRGLKAVPYLCLTWITDSIPEWRYFRKQWDMGAVDPSIPDAGWHHGFHMTSPVGKGYSDFLMSQTKDFMDRYGIDGVYHDQTSPYAAASPDSGVGYVRDGKAYPAYPILGYRALYRRDYAVVKSLPRETFTMAHMSGKVTIPILAYDDSYLDGEHFRGLVKDSYLDVMTLDSFRAEYMGRQWGVMPFFLPEFDAEHAQQVEPTRGLMALLMVHDVSPWPIWCNGKVVNEAFEALDEFGTVDADFIPYFDPTPPATTAMSDVYASAYKKPDGRVLLIISNLSKEDRQGVVTINAARLGVKLNSVIDWPGKQPLTVANGNLALDVPKLGYRMVVIGKP
jgi:hypothetical protein